MSAKNLEHAFTMDRTLIYNIVVYDLPRKTTLYKITEYFQKFGKVLKVRFQASSCFIYFDDPKVVTKILQKRCHVFKDSDIRVEPIYGYRETDAEKLVKNLSHLCISRAARTKRTNSLPIAIKDSLVLNLNDDCLQHICKYLPLTDQINFALSCRRFYNIMVMISRIYYSSLDGDILRDLSQWQLKTFLRIVGPQIKHLQVCLLNYKSIFLGQYCLNVEKLKLVFCTNWPMVIRMITNMTLLQEIDCVGKINLDFMEYIKRFKHLKILRLRSLASYKGKSIYQLIGLEKLVLERCPKITSYYFKRICYALTNLIELEIKECTFLDSDDYNHIPKYLLKLETLRIPALRENFECILQLPKLTNLEIVQYFNTKIPESFTTKLVEFKADQLQELTLLNDCTTIEMATSIAELRKLKILYCNCVDRKDEILSIFSQLTELKDVFLEGCNNFHNKAVLQFLEKCWQLKKVTLMYCDGLEPQLIRDLMNVLQKQEANWLRTYPLNLYLTFKYNYKDKIKEFKAIAKDINNDLLKLKVDFVFPMPDNLYYYDSDDFQQF